MSSKLEAYLPRVAIEWDGPADGASWQSLDGSLVLVDISGFTALSERLAQKGRRGAEELTSVLNRVFGQMLDVVDRRGGSLLKFGGDALLLFFTTDDHIMQACAATVEMRAALRSASQEPTSVGRIDLKMSSGINSGSVDFYLVGDSHRELMITGPAASLTTEMEHTAGAGEIVMSESVRAAVPAAFIGDPRGRGWILRKRTINHPPADQSSDTGAPGDRALTSLVPLALRQHLESGVDASEHRIASIGFVRFSGVDTLARDEGPDRVASAIHDLVTAAQHAADREEVTFLGSDVDADGAKLILAAGVPTSRHDDEGRILRALRSIVTADVGLDVRAGVNRGHVYVANVGSATRRTYTVMGDTVNLAARVMAAAGPGELYSTPGVLNLSSTLFRTEPLEAFHVKGKEMPIQAFAVHEETGVRPPELESDLPFHGRETELEMLVGVVNTCSRLGRGGMMTITGETGLGKTRLITEVLDRCSGMDVLMIQAEPSGIDNPYWAFRDPLRRALDIERASQPVMASRLAEAVAESAPELEWALPLLGDVLHIDIADNEATSQIDAQFRPERTADALVDLLVARHSRPIAIVAEDGQWLDEASVRLLDRVGAAASDHPWTVLVTSRTVPEQGFSPLGSGLSLPPLEYDAMRAIAVEATQAAPLRPHELEQILSRADGNPLFLGEILRVVAQTGSAEQLPDSLDAVISTEIDTLPPVARQLLRYSSVLGRRFRREVLDEFLEPEHLEVDAVTGQELGRFIESEDEGRLAFRHSVVHDIAYSSLSYAKRRELHARAGDVIERQAGGDPDSVAEYLSTHYSQSGAHDKAWRYARKAAEKAQRAYANVEAAAHLTRALEAGRHSDEATPDELAEVWTHLGEVRDLSGQYEAARDAYSQALHTGNGNANRAVDLYLRRAETWYGSGRLSEAKRNVTLGRRYLADVESEGRRRAEARLDAYQASIHAGSGDVAGARLFAERALETATQAGEDEALARAYQVMDWVCFVEGSGDDADYGIRAVDIYERLGLIQRSALVLNNMGAFEYWKGNWDRALVFYRRAVDSAERSGNVVEAASARTAIAEVLIGQNRAEEATAPLEDAERVVRATRANEVLPFVLLQKARARRAMGDPEASVGILESLFTEQTQDGETPWTGEIAVSLAQCLIEIGRVSEGEAVLDALRDLAPDSAAQVGPGMTRVRALALVAVGDERAALSSLDDALEGATADGDLYQEVMILEDLRRVAGEARWALDSRRAGRLSSLYDKLGVRIVSVSADSST